MGRSPCCDDNSGLKKGPWTPEEDEKLASFIQKHGHGSWRALPKVAGLNRCGKSCRLRWTNYLRPDIKRGPFSQEEEDLIIKLHSFLGNKWSRIASHLHGRTDNEIKNYWNTHLRKKLLQMGIDPITHKPRTDLNLLSNLSQLLSSSPNLGSLINPWDNMNINNNSLTFQPNIAQLAKLQVLQNIFQILNTSHHNNHVPSIDQSTPSNLGFQNVNNITNINPTIGSNSQLQNEYFQIANYVNGINQIQGDQFHGNIEQSWPSLDTSNKNNGNNNNNNNNNKSSASIISTYNNINNLDENRMPSLVNISHEGSTMKQPESNTNSTSGSDLTPTGGAHFEGWEKLLLHDDGTSDSFWKQFLN